MSELLERDGEVLDANTIRFERLLPGPIERVWAFLTESEKRKLWLAAGDFELKPGGKTTLFFQHKNLSAKRGTPPEQYKKMDEEGGGFHGEVVSCEAPRLLVITWGEKRSSEVMFELTPQSNGEVLLTLTHRRLDKEGMQSVGPGWHTHLGILAERLHGREPDNFWVTLQQVKARYERKFQ
ncbi:MAG: SRPBCC family protein [Xanthobacteraceae bacterium]